MGLGGGLMLSKAQKSAPSQAHSPLATICPIDAGNLGFIDAAVLTERRCRPLAGFGSLVFVQMGSPSHDALCKSISRLKVSRLSAHKDLKGWLMRGSTDAASQKACAATLACAQACW